jgi:hypothetical protein
MAAFRMCGACALLVVLNACAQAHTALLTDAGASSSGAGTVAGTSAGGGTGSAGSSASSGSGTGGTAPTSGTSNSGTTGNGDTTGSPGPAPCIWVGDVCSRASCTNASIGDPCVLDGGLGVCQGGRCVAQLVSAPGGTCGPDQTDQLCGFLAYCCDGGCLNSYAEDPTNCGGCGVHCSDGTACDYGSCVPSHACLPTENGLICTLPSLAFGTCCQGSCVADLNSDPGHCGSCSRICLAGSSCAGGFCGPGTVSCSQTSDPCPAGYRCGDFGTGQPFCVLSACGLDTDGIECALAGGGTFGLCCGGACTEVGRDPANCGGCGITCIGGDSCFSGRCGTLSDCRANGDVCLLDGGGVGACCAGSCVAHPNADPRACGATPCGSGGTCTGSASCVGGLCVPEACDAGVIACQGGVCCGATCVDLAHDPLNCGACGAICPPGKLCRNGYCGGTCAQCPWASGYYCDQGDFHACVSPSCNPSLEGQPCATANGTAGMCCGGSCVDGFDPNNCGQCGVSCATGICQFSCNVVGCVVGCSGGVPAPDCFQSCGVGTACAGGACVGSSCSPVQEFEPCLAEDGGLGVCCGYSCAQVESDAANCGACGLACPAGMSCLNGYCNGVRTCGPGYAFDYCNLDAGLWFLCCPGIGCVDLLTDPQNCRSCGQTCDAGQICRLGICQ